MTLWQAGMRITAARLNDTSVDETTTSGATVESGWTLNSFSGRRKSGITTIMIFINRSGADTAAESSAGSGNISPDITIATLPDGWRPPETTNGNWGNGISDGEAVLNTDGTIVLRTINGSSGIQTGTNVRLCANWIG